MIVRDLLNTIKADPNYVPNSLHFVNEACDSLVYQWLKDQAGKYEMHSMFIATIGSEILPCDERTVVVNGELKDPNAHYRLQATL